MTTPIERCEASTAAIATIRPMAKIPNPKTRGDTRALLGCVRAASVLGMGGVDGAVAASDDRPGGTGGGSVGFASDAAEGVPASQSLTAWGMNTGGGRCGRELCTPPFCCQSWTAF